MLALPDMVAIMDVQLVAYGNTKYVDGEFTCQHGEDECTTDVYHSCVEYKLSGDLNSIETGDTALQAWPFILCMEKAEGDPSKAESCYNSSMNSTDVPWSTISTCEADESDIVQKTAMKATLPHDFVPWVTVDGEFLEHTNLLQKAICDAYTGTKPASCKTHLLIDDEIEVGRCYM